MMRQLLPLILIGALGGGLAACGKQGDLDRPGPLWGPKAKADYEAQKRKEADDQTRQSESDQRDTPAQGGPGVDTTTLPAPPRSAPIQGQSPDPFKSQPQGAMPDPFTYPDRPQ